LQNADYVSEIPESSVVTTVMVVEEGGVDMVAVVENAVEQTVISFIAEVGERR